MPLGSHWGCSLTSITRRQEWRSNGDLGQLPNKKLWSLVQIQVPSHYLYLETADCRGGRVPGSEDPTPPQQTCALRAPLCSAKGACRVWLGWLYNGESEVTRYFKDYWTQRWADIDEMQKCHHGLPDRVGLTQPGDKWNSSESRSNSSLGLWAYPRSFPDLEHVIGIDILNWVLWLK